MRSRVQFPRRLVGPTLLVAAGVVVGCAHASQTGYSGGKSWVGSSGNIYRFAAGNARAVHETRTTSFALDRIDQRTLPLDNTFRRAGTGRGVTVYVFDGGILPTHPELAGRVRIGYTAFPDDPKICNAHGTAVAGAIAGATMGVAPEAEIVDVKMVQCGSLRGTVQGIVEGAKWVIEDRKRRPGPAVANWSFIADTAARIPELEAAIELLRGAGIPVIVSAGNVDINACRISPGNAPGSFVVGASTVRTTTTVNGETQQVDVRVPGTAWGPCIDIYAPGDSVMLPSVDRELKPMYQLWNGTSMSTGYVSGAAALLLEAYPDATPDDVAGYLKETATPNVLHGAYGPIKRLLFVGAPRRMEREPLRSVAEVREEMERRR